MTQLPRPTQVHKILPLLPHPEKLLHHTQAKLIRQFRILVDPLHLAPTIPYVDEQLANRTPFACSIVENANLFVGRIVAFCGWVAPRIEHVHVCDGVSEGSVEEALAEDVGVGEGVVVGVGLGGVRVVAELAVVVGVVAEGWGCVGSSGGNDSSTS